MNESGVWIRDWKKEKKKEEMAMALSKWIHAIHTEHYLTLLRDIFKIEIFYYFSFFFHNFCAMPQVLRDNSCKWVQLDAWT